MTGYLLQHSPQDRNGFESFFDSCLAGLSEDPQAWVFLRGDGVYQGLREQTMEDPGFTVPVKGGWNALLARGVKVYINERCARLRGLVPFELFLPEAKMVQVDTLARLSLQSGKVVVL